MAIQPKLALGQRNAPLLIQLRAGLRGKEKEQLPSPLGAQDGWDREIAAFSFVFCCSTHMGNCVLTGYNMKTRSCWLWERVLLPLSNTHTCKEYSPYQPPHSSEQMCEMPVIISLFLLHFGYAILAITAMQNILHTFHLRSTSFFHSLHGINVRHCKAEVWSKISTDVKT